MGLTRIKLTTPVTPVRLWTAFTDAVMGLTQSRDCLHTMTN